VPGAVKRQKEKLLLFMRIEIFSLRMKFQTDAHKNKSDAHKTASPPRQGLEAGKENKTGTV